MKIKVVKKGEVKKSVEVKKEVVVKNDFNWLEESKTNIAEAKKKDEMIRFNNFGR